MIQTMVRVPQRREDGEKTALKTFAGAKALRTPYFMIGAR
jgi:hypothetical protein